MPSPYRALFDAPGSKGFSAAGFIGRMPLSMMGIGVVTMVSQLTGRYGLAGALTATIALSAAALGPQISRLVDRHGQRRVLRPATAAALAATAGLLLAVHFGGPDWVLFVCAAGIGSVPSLGAMIRARWAGLYRGTPQLHTAYSFESVVDEVCFIFGPIISIGLSTAWFPEAGPLLAACFLAVGVFWLTAQRGTEPAPHPRERKGAGSALRSPGLQVLVATFVATGTIFGAVDVVTVAFADEQGHKRAASLVLALYAAGSCAAGLAFGLLRPKGAPERRWLFGVFMMAVSMIPLLLVGNLPFLAVALFVAGLAIAPTMITTMSLIEEHVPRAHLTEGMTWVSTGLAVGIAVGSSLAGWVIDAAGARAGYGVPAVAGAVAVAVGFLGYRRLRRPAPGREAALSSTVSRKSGTWRNWGGTVASRPAREVVPASVEELAAAVRRAGEDGLTVKAVGTGHSFTSIAATDGVLIRPQLLTGIRDIDRQALTVTVEAGTPLKRLNLALAREGLSLTNMGDIMEQTVAGATSTGTHGTGRESASIAAQIKGLELVTADGSVLTCSEKENADVFAAARIGLGALGIVTAITFAVEPLFLLSAREEPMPFDRVLADFDQLWAENEHFEFYWFPHTGSTNTKRNNRSAGPRRPVGRLAGWFEDEFLSNGVFQAAQWVGRAAPATVPAIAQVSSRALSARAYTDIPYRVFTSPRRVRFVEMEYAVPREAVTGALRELRAMVERSPLRISFPVEVRTALADDITLSTASGRDSAYIAVHMAKGTPYQGYFTAAEQIFTAHEGRPHWGKIHTRDAEYLARAYPRFGEFTALRDRLDPDRRFQNDYLRRVLGT